MLHVARMLSRYNDAGNADGFAVFVDDRNLRFRVWPQPADFVILANTGEFAPEPMRKHDRRRREFWRLVAGVTEHQSLIARALFCGVLTFNRTGVYALCDIGRLFREDVGDENFVGVKYVVVIHVANAADRVAHELFDRQDTRQRLIFREAGNGDLATYDDDVAFGERFASHATAPVMSDARIEHG